MFVLFSSFCLGFVLAEWGIGATYSPREAPEHQERRSSRERDENRKLSETFLCCLAVKTSPSRVQNETVNTSPSPAANRKGEIMPQSSHAALFIFLRVTRQRGKIFLQMFEMLQVFAAHGRRLA